MEQTRVEGATVLCSDVWFSLAETCWQMLGMAALKKQNGFQSKEILNDSRKRRDRTLIWKEITMMEPNHLC